MLVEQPLKAGQSIHVLGAIPTETKEKLVQGARDMMNDDIRPECIQEATEAEHGNDHESRELREHSSQRQNHEVVFQSDEHKPDERSVVIQKRSGWRTTEGRAISQSMQESRYPNRGNASLYID